MLVKPGQRVRELGAAVVVLMIADLGAWGFVAVATIHYRP